jgi:hypothetical protein
MNSYAYFGIAALLATVVGTSLMLWANFTLAPVAAVFVGGALLQTVLLCIATPQRSGE